MFDCCSNLTADALHPHSAGQIGYAIVGMAASGRMLGLQQPIILHLLDIEPAKQALEGVKMELMDAAYPLLIGEKEIIPGRKSPAGHFAADQHS